MGILSSLGELLGLAEKSGRSRAPEEVAPVVVLPAPADPRPPGSDARYLSEDEAKRLFVPDEHGALPVTIRDGFFVHLPTGKKVPPANTALAALGVLSLRVRGIKYFAGHRTANTSPGEPALLRREPKNEHDPHAVAVYGLLPSGRASKVGYVNKGNAGRLARRLDSGEPVEARFMRGDPPGESGFTPCIVIVDVTFRQRIPHWP